MPCAIVREQEAKQLKKSTLFGPGDEKAYNFQAIASPVSRNMTAGYLRLRDGYTKEFVSPVDEVDLFLEGSLTYSCEGKSFTARKGDIAFIEKGSKVKFTADEDCFVFFVTYPLMQEAIEALRKQNEK